MNRHKSVTGYMIGVTAVLLCVLGYAHFTSKTRTILAICQRAKLASFPVDYSRVQISTVNQFTWAATYIEFPATGREIGAFIKASPGIIKSVEHFNPKHMYLPLYPNLGRENPAHEYFDDHALRVSAPWFTPTITTLGRRYQMDKHNPDINRGEVVIDDSKQIVWIALYEGS